MVGTIKRFRSGLKEEDCEKLDLFGMEPDTIFNSTQQRLASYSKASKTRQTSGAVKGSGRVVVIVVVLVKVVSIKLLKLLLKHYFIASYFQIFLCWLSLFESKMAHSFSLADRDGTNTFSHSHI